MQPKAALLRSAMCLTTAKPRPSPTLFYFPGLTSKAWHDINNFPWIHELERNHDIIRNEFYNIKNARATQESDYKLQSQEDKLHEGQWNWLSFITKGEKQLEFMKYCPKTVEILIKIPGLMTNIPFAYAFFSILKPQSSIKAHSAPCNIRLRCHFPLIVPESCGIRVGDEIREWKEGKAMIFDDSYDHEVWHDGTKENGDRIVLLFDLWHPDLIQAERDSLIALFQQKQATKV